MNQLLTENVRYFLIFCIIIIATFLIAYLVRQTFRKVIKRISLLEDSNVSNYSFFSYIASALIYVIGFSMAIYSVPALKSIGSTLLAGAGVVALAVSFASQQALSNIISGLFIIIFKPFKTGDRITFKGNTLAGIIEDITLRHTVVKDYENRRIIVPNTIISDEVIVNADYNGDPICRWVNIGISYGSDIDLAKSIMAEEAAKHPLRIDRRTPEDIEKGVPEIMVRVINLGAYSVDLRAWVWAENQANAFVVGCDLNESIKKRFDAEGVEIPFPHQVNILKKVN